MTKVPRIMIPPRVQPEARRCGLSNVHRAHQWNHDPTDTIYACDGNPDTDTTIAPREEYVRTRDTSEPVFTIRAQDILAPQALAAYAALARKLDLHEHAQRVEAIAVDFLAWQAANHHQVKRPD